MNTRKSVLSIIAALILTISGSVSAQTIASRTSFDNRFVRQALNVLNSDLPAIVEGSILLSIELKNRYPDQKFDKIVKKLEDLEREGLTLSIRYKAGLASIYFNNYELLKDVKVEDRDNPDKCFKLIAEKLQADLLATN